MGGVIPDYGKGPRSIPVACAAKATEIERGRFPYYQVKNEFLFSEFNEFLFNELKESQDCQYNFFIFVFRVREMFLSFFLRVKFVRPFELVWSAHL